MSDSDPENSTNMIYEHIQDNTTEQEWRDAYGYSIKLEEITSHSQCDYRKYELCVPSHFLIQIGMCPFYVNQCNVTNTLLSHGASQVSFQSTKCIKRSFRWTRCSRYHCKDVHHCGKSGNMTTKSFCSTSETALAMKPRARKKLECIFCSASRISPSML